MTGCPLELIGRDVWEVLDYASLFGEKGCSPVAGGIVDQAKVFIDACRFIWSEEAIARNQIENRQHKRA